MANLLACRFVHNGYQNMSNNEALGVQIPLIIKTITPLHIGGNDVLSPLADYWMDDQKNIHLINEAELANSVYETGNTNKYIREVEAIVTEKKGKMLQDFVRYSLQREIKDMLTGISFKSYGIHNPVEIDCCIQTNGLGYLPGSSLKGALRGALLLSWLSSGKPESDKALDDFIRALTTFSKRSDLRKNQQAAEIEKVFREQAEEKLFGNLKQDERLAASCLRVNDSGTIAENDIAVYQLERFNLSDNKDTIPVLKQCIDRGTSLSTTVYIDYYICHQKYHHPIFRDIISKRDLFALLNSVSLQLINYELNVLRSEEIVTGRINIYEAFLDKLKETIHQSGNSKGFLRLGFGKMQFYQTVAMALYKKTGMDENNSDWIEYLSYCDGLSGDIPAIYPATRVLSSAGLEPLGWVEFL